MSTNTNTDDTTADEQEVRVERQETADGHAVFERVGKPEPAVRFEEATEPKRTHYRYEWDDRGTPAPELFDRVSHIEVLLCVLMSDLEGEAKERAQEAHEALVAVKKVMVDHRGIEEENQRRDLLMGNIDALPEVESRVEPVNTDGGASEDPAAEDDDRTEGQDG